ncbi:MAG TPA: NosD domain-containing protein [Acidimicrobiia bacterium]|nr:NosD domain-containing protein [Acidimicrobiia bacterium]
MRSGRKSGNRRLLTLALLVSLVAALIPFSPAPPALGSHGPFVVTSNGDGPDLERGDGLCATADGVCTLRAAIEEANAHPNDTDPIVPDVIHFDIRDEPSVGGEHVIQPSEPLPAITETVDIDATTQTQLHGSVIVLDGTNAGAGTGLALSSGDTTTSSGSLIRGFVIRNFQGAGIVIFGTSNGNLIIGSVIHGNGNDGIQVQTDGNTIGGEDGELNVIYGNTNAGVQLAGDANTVFNNQIGTLDGLEPAPNGTGVYVTGAGNLIDRNLVSGNTHVGVQISGETATGNKITRNHIGTNVDDLQGGVGAALPNGTGDGGLGGVIIQSGATGNFIGLPEQGNVISGNAAAGITISGADGNEVIDNGIGTDWSRSLAIGNSGPGIRLLSANSNAIADNKVSGNSGNGVLISGGGSNILRLNYIGIKASGDVALGNSGNGVQIIDSPSNTIGGADAARNLISGNVGEGIRIDGAKATNNRIEDNYVGTSADGLTDVGNGASGIYIRRAPGNLVLRNLVSGNDGFAGITICGDPEFCGGGSLGSQTNNASANIVQGNWVGIDGSGTGALGNRNRGVSIDGAPSTEISGNTIAHNGFAGVVIFNAGAVANQVVQNSIHSNGGLGINLVGNDTSTGVTPNDSLDADTGPNNLQNFPVIASALSNGTTTEIEGTLDSAQGSNYTIEFFASDVCDDSLHGEGQQFLASTLVTTNADGHAVVATSYSAALTAGTQITATATDAAGNTSEFSECVTVEEAAPDLIGSITGPLQACLGEEIGDEITLQVTNQGATAVSGTNFSVGVYLSTDAAVTTSDSLLVGGRETVLGTTVIGPGETIGVPLFDGASVPSSMSTGPAYLGLVVDEFNVIAEGDETNNSAAIPITINTCATVGFDLNTSSGFEGTTHSVDVVLSLLEGIEALQTSITVTIVDANTGTATALSDYTLDLETPSVTFDVGSSDGAVQSVDLSLLSDSEVETTETVDLKLTGVVGPGTLDSDRVNHRVSIFNTSVGEGIAFTAVNPASGDLEIPIDGPPEFGALGFIPFFELDPLAAARTGSPGAEEEMESVGSGIGAIGSGIGAIGSGIGAIGSGIGAIGSGIGAIGSGIGAIGSGISAIDIGFIGSGIGAIGSGIGAIGSGIGAIDPPLSTIPITNAGDSWEQRLLGTVFEGSPLQSITLSQIAADAPTVLDGLTLGDVDFSSSAFGSLTLASVTVGNLPLSTFLTEAECDALLGSLAPTDCGATTVLAADIAGADLSSIGSGIAAIRVSDVDLDVQPIGTITLGAIGSGIGAICEDTATFDCSDGDQTLAQAQNAGALDPDLLLGHLYLLLLPPQSYNWTELPVDLLQVDVGPLARYDLTFTRQGTGAAATTVQITLPAGVHYEPETVSLAALDALGNALPAPDPGEPTFTDGVLEWVFDTTPGVRYDLSFQGRINIMPLGVHRASASVTAAGATLSATNAAPITITENFESNDTPGDAKIIDDNGLYVSYLPDGTDEDYFTFAIPNGRNAKVLLHHLDDDFDLIYYEPSVLTEASSRKVSEFGPTTPPLDDEGRHSGDVPLDPEAANDLDLASVGSGIGAIGSGIGAIASNRGTAEEIVEGQTDSTAAGQSGIRVAGYNQASSSQAYLLQLKFVQSFDVVCAPLELTLGSASSLPTSAPLGTDTLILWNAQRTEAVYDTQARTDLEGKISELVGALDLQGHTPFVIPIDGSQAVRDAYAAWDTDPCSAGAANGVVAAINDLVDSYKLAPPQLQSITIIGSDALVPYERRPDLTDIANEREYGPALRNTASNAQTGEFGALSGGYVLSNDAYASFTSIYDWLGHPLYLPDVAIGRVVELPGEIINQIDQFMIADGILNPATAVTDLDALVTGYDFLIDGAEAQADALDASYGSGATDRSLNDDLWNALGLEEALMPTTPELPDEPSNVIGIGAHFDHQRLFPADIGAVGSTPSAGIAYSTGDLLANSLSAALVNRVIFSVGCHSGLTVPDGITLPGGGSTSDWAQAFSSVGAVFIGNTGFGYGLHDAVGLSEKLMERFSQRLDGTYFIGDALTSAKQEHFAHQLVYGPYDEKVLAESTLFGFPFWRLTNTVTPVGEQPPGAPPSGTQSLTFTHTLETTPSGDYYTTGGQSTELFHRPIQPQEILEYLTDGAKATGVMIRGLTSTDKTPFDPVFARPIFDLADNEPELETPGTIFPNVFASTSSRETTDGTVSTVALATGQFIGEGQGAQRLFTEMDIEVLFGATGGSAPEIISAEAELSNPSVAFRVELAGNAEEVLVLYKASGLDPGEVTWSALDLNDAGFGSNVWTGSVDLPSLHQVEWFAQVRKGTFVSTSFNKGVLYAARLVDAGADAELVEGDTFTLDGSFIDPAGGSSHSATVDWGDGTPVEPASINVSTISGAHVYTDDGVHAVEVCVTPLDGGTECDTLTAVVVNAEPLFGSSEFSATGSVVTVTAQFGDPGSDDTHTATVDWGDETTTEALIDPATRTLIASHDYSTTPGTINVVLVDDDGGETTLTRDVDVPIVGPVAVSPDPVAVATLVEVTAPFTDPDATGGYSAVIDWGDGTEPTVGTVTPGTSGTGTVTGSHVYDEPGVYKVAVTVTDQDSLSGTAFISIEVVPTLDWLLGVLQSLIDANPGSDLADKLEDVLQKLQTAVNELGKSPPDRQAAAGNIEGAVGDLEAAIKDELIDPKKGIDLAGWILDVARRLAAEAIADAEAANGDPAKLAEAQEYLSRGDTLRDKGKFKDAAAAYKNAVATAEGA